MQESRLWFERLYEWRGLPYWAGVIIIAWFPFIAGTALAHLAAGLWNVFVSEILTVFLPASIALIVSQFAIRDACSRMDGLCAYAQSMCDDTSPVMVAPLYSARNALLTGALVFVTTTPVFVLTVPPEYSPVQTALTQLVTWPYFTLLAGAFVWVWGYSIIAIYRMGRRPLKVRSFTEDRLLGLRPFARTSLRLSSIYLAVVAIIALPQIIGGAVGLPATVLFLALLLLGLVFFLVPLVPLHRQLQVAKEEKARWIAAEYSRAIGPLETTGDGLDDHLALRLIAIDKLQRDIQQIRTWPFEAGLFARFTAILVSSVTAVLVARALAIALGS